MASATEVEPSVDALRAKYTELAHKYAQLVERLEPRATRALAMYRLGSFGLRITGAAFALVGGGRIQVANARFTELARATKGHLLPVEPQDVAHPDLRTLVLAFAERMVRERTAAIQTRYRGGSSDALLSFRFERNVQSGEPLVLVVAEDISEHAGRDPELVQAREAMLHRERLRVLGELAASIAHDLGNTLRGASFQLATLKEEALSAEQRLAAVTAVAERIEIASEAIARLHDFARTGALGLAAVRLDRIVEHAAALVDIDFRSSVAPVAVRISVPELPCVRGSVAELSLLFVNLLRNARDAMPAGGTVTVAAHLRKRQVMVTVEDEGKGISAGVQRRLFEPFFTTKGSRGTGLGLWLAAGTMERLGGEIRATNRARGGALFTLSFPLVELDRAGRVHSPVKRRGAARPAASAPSPRPIRRTPGSERQT
jgi:signal transduction histidine kinase